MPVTSAPLGCPGGSVRVNRCIRTGPAASGCCGHALARGPSLGGGGEAVGTAGDLHSARAHPAVELERPGGGEAQAEVGAVRRRQSAHFWGILAGGVCTAPRPVFTHQSPTPGLSQAHWAAWDVSWGSPLPPEGWAVHLPQHPGTVQQHLTYEPTQAAPPLGMYPPPPACSGHPSRNALVTAQTHPLSTA